VSRGNFTIQEKEKAMVYRIGFAGTDGRTLLSALETSKAKSERSQGETRGVVIRGTPSMPEFSRLMNWPVDFIPTEDNSLESYSRVIVESLKEGAVDCILPMPEALLFEGLVDKVNNASPGLGDRVAGLTREGAFIEADKIKCKEFCAENGIPVADEWRNVDGRDYEAVLKICLDYFDRFGGAALKYPYSAGGKGARVIRSPWEIREVYDTLMRDYKDNYRKLHGKKKNWPLLIESLMSGVEISFTVLVDREGHFQILPTAMDYPERYAGPAGKDNPITGGMGSVSPHPMETGELISMAAGEIVRPLVAGMEKIGIMRPCVLYPGCFISLGGNMRPRRIRVSEINIRPGEPEFQPVVRRLRNLGPLVRAMFDGTLNEVTPEVREDQVSICLALVTGPGGPKGQKGYPWSCTINEHLEIDMEYFRKKGIQLIPSALSWDREEKIFKSDGTRVAYLNGNATVKGDGSLKGRSDVAERLRNKLIKAYDNGKIRVVPRENGDGNRLDLRRDVGSQYHTAEDTFPL
jgi:phosphoribosylamine--glycine ligase